MLFTKTVSRRQLLTAGAVMGAALALAACGGGSAAQSTTSSASASTGGSASSEWDKLVAAAKQEGKLNIIIPPGEIYRHVVDAFAQKYGISLEAMVGNGNADIVPKLDLERKGGQFRWDVISHSPGSLHNGLKPIGAMEPIKPALILPEAIDDSKWFNGFDAGWADLDKSYVYQFFGFAQPVAKVNRSTVPESQLSKLDQIWDPAWTGKIAMQDPKIPSAGVQAGTVILLGKGEDKLRSLYAQQKPAVTQDRRQLGEWMVRGQYPVGVGVAPDSLSPLSDQGVDVKMIRPLDPADPAGAYYTAGTGSLGLINKAPHPNAARLYVNWALTAEAQTLYSKQAGFNSRRNDVPVVDEDTKPDPNRKYQMLDQEANYAIREKTIAIAKELLAG